MKIALKPKLVKLQLIKFKIYKSDSNEKSKKITENMCLEFIELNLKKALHIIHNYNIKKKTIFFIGLPKKIQNDYVKLLQQTNHLFFPEFIWIKGILTNKVSIFKYIQQQINSNIKSHNIDLKLLFSIQRKPDLIVLFNKKTESEAFQEAIKLRIPVIAITIDLSLEKGILYPIYGNFRFLNKRLGNLCFILLNSILKK